MKFCQISKCNKKLILTITHLLIVISDHSICSFTNPNRIHDDAFVIEYGKSRRTCNAVGCRITIAGQAWCQTRIAYFAVTEPCRRTCRVFCHSCPYTALRSASVSCIKYETLLARIAGSRDIIAVSASTLTYCELSEGGEKKKITKILP